MNVDRSPLRSAPRRLRRLAARPPAALVPFSLALACGGTLWLQAIHGIQGVREPSAPPAPLLWLRDSALALPLVVLAVWIALLLARPLVARAGRPLAGGTLAALVALGGAAAAAALSPLRGWLFGVHHHRDGAAMPWAVHMATEGALALAADLAIAALVVAFLLRGRGGDPARCLALRRLRPVVAMQRLSGLALAASMLLGGLIGQTPAAVAAATDPGSPCPAGAPMKTFNITALDVKIPLNRFGDNDPFGKMLVLNQNIGAVRAQVANPDYKNRVSIGLHGGDAIQALVIRANEGDCVTANFTNSATGGEYGLHIDGLAFNVDSSGDAVGNNSSSAVPNTPGANTATYVYYVPNDPALEGMHYIHPGPGNRAAVNHGLFGALVVEPPGSVYLNPVTSSADGVHPDAARPLASGWEAEIVPGNGDPAFHEDNLIYHEIGSEDEHVFDVNGNRLPENDPLTGSYRPGSRALNYRSEPFMDRLLLNDEQKSVVYGSYTFGDPATPMPRGYQGDPTKQRILHAGSEVFHIHHLHGGGDRWRTNPKADPTYSYFATGLDKHPKAEASDSLRLDSQSLGPGETYNLEIEGGAGGVQQGAGEFLFHCHIAEHYFSGMWSFWRVFDTLQPDLAPLPQRAPLAAAVNSAELVKLGKAMADGTVLTADNLDAWVRPQLPPQGVKRRGANGFSQDAAVMDWKVDTSTGAPVYVGEVEDTGGWVDAPRIPALGAHTGSLIVDRFLPGANGNRPVILFNPTNGRPAFPLLRMHAGDRPPFAPNMHSGAPYLGEHGMQAPATGGGAQPFANRADAICPTGVADNPDPLADPLAASAPQIRRNNLVGINLPIQNTKAGVTDQGGALFVLAQEKEAVRANPALQQPIAIRANIGDCEFNTLVSEEHDGNPELPFAKVNIHIHHVQFDTQASDGVISGFSYEQSVRPYQLEDVQLAAAAPAGATTITVNSVAKFLDADGSVRRTGIAVGEGLGTLDVEQIATIDVANKTITLAKPLAHGHAAGEWAGVEYVQYIWYPDVELDNIFFHDHVNGIHGWSHGMVGQYIIEPKGSTYHDPTTGRETWADPTTGKKLTATVRTIADIHTASGLAAQQVPGSFREAAFWTIDNHSTVGSSINLKAEPWKDRTSAGDASLRFSSYTYGDPYTPLIRAYPGDPVVIRTINVGQNMQTFHVDGHRISAEPRYVDPAGKIGNETTPVNTIHYGISERFTLILEGGAGGPNKVPGDYLYNDGVERSFEAGAWGIVRVLGGADAGLQPLPGYNAPAAPAATLSKTGGRPPAAANTTACPTAAPVHTFKVSAVDLPISVAGGGQAGRKAAYVLDADVAAVRAGTKFPEPLVLHAAEGECVSVTLTNWRATRASFHLDGLLRDINSSGINVGFNPEQSVAPLQLRTNPPARIYTFYADKQQIQAAPIADFGGDGSRDGLYGGLVVAPKGATFSDPKTGTATDHGSQVDVHVPGKPAYRDFTLVLADQDPIIGQSVMPYPRDVAGPALVNYRSAGNRPADANMFSSIAHGDPATPLLMANAGDPMVVHVLNAQGSEQLHTVSLGGLSWTMDDNITHGESLSTRGVGPQEKFDARINGGAGGWGQMVGDFAYQDRRLAFTEAGMWGLIRVLDPATANCTTAPIRALICAVVPAPPTPTATSTPSGTPAPIPSSRSGSGTSTATGTATSTTTGTVGATATASPTTGAGPAPMPASRSGSKGTSTATATVTATATGTVSIGGGNGT